MRNDKETSNEGMASERAKPDRPLTSVFMRGFRGALIGCFLGFLLFSITGPHRVESDVRMYLMFGTGALIGVAVGVCSGVVRKAPWI